MIKINLIREGRAAVRGPIPAGVSPSGPSSVNNTLLVGLIIVGVLVSGAYWMLKDREKKAKEALVVSQREQAAKLEKIIAEVERFQRRKDMLQKRIDLINELKRNQKGPVRVLDRISQDLPDLVWLDRMTLTGARIDLNGRALNPNAFANYVENIKSDPMFDEPEVGAVRESGRTAGGASVYTWNMSFNFRWAPAAEVTPASSPGEPAEAGGDAVEAPPAS
ncbi:MAG TPA: PilN domain-containing protein [Thermoanaerobaculia bacterium]|nr:PilN domain-containing protein [Thermoanaerobaculia bacterium]